jgi:hypothetical protein
MQDKTENPVQKKSRAFFSELCLKIIKILGSANAEFLNA